MSMSEADWAWVTAMYERAAELGDDELSAFLHAAGCERPDLARVLADLLVDGVERGNAYAGSLSRELELALDEPPLGPGTMVGAYRIRRLLGGGGMGRVYLADRLGGRPKVVALKISATVSGPPADGSRAEREWVTLDGLEHPCIPRFIDAGHASDGRAFFALEFVDGETADLFAASTSARAVVTMFHRLCSAVAHCHDRNIIHCDIKPANVLVRHDGLPALIDFGIAQRRGRARTATAQIGPLSPNSAAPELLLGEPADERTDVYSLGLLLYRLLAGEHLYKLDLERGIDLVEQLSTLSPAQRRLPDNLAPFASVIRTAVNLDKRRRYSSVRQMTAALASVGV